MDRHLLVGVVAEALYEGFVKEDGGFHLSRTGSLLLANNLRVHKVRKGFQILFDAVESKTEDKRVWTKAIVRKALTKMMKDNNLVVPQTPGFTWAEWLKQQSESVQELCQRARKNAWLRKMDTGPTVPYDPEDRYGIESQPSQ